MKHLLLLISALVMLSACNATVSDPSATIETDTGYNIHINKNSNDYKHCPPGHAKKGWC